ncbi:putative conjugal transfer protein TraP [Escherichia coli 2749250]|nr:putative conjugal transfer protein TraP [Escherichia coli 2749250]
MVFQDGFQLKTVEEMALEQSQSTAEEGNPESPVPNLPSAESHLNGFNTDQMLKQLGNLNPQQFMSGDKNPQGGDAGREGGNGGGCTDIPCGVCRSLAAVGRQVCGYLAAGNNGPDGSVCFMEGQHHAGEITG